jgi:ABC-type lipoprotein release transport system permease subunit
MLARWRWQTQRSLLLIAGVGILCAVTLVAALPLFSNVMATAGLRNVLRAQSDSARITANITLEGLSGNEVAHATALANRVMRKDVGPYLSGSPQTAVVTGNWYLNHSGFTMNFYGAPLQEARTHLQLLRGRLPDLDSANPSTLEVMLTSSAASELDVTVGDSIPLTVLFLTKLDTGTGIGSPGGPMPYAVTLNAYVVGIFRVQANDAYWNGHTFEAPPLEARLVPPPFLAVTDQSLLVQDLDTISQEHGAAAIFASDKSISTIFVAYTLNASIVTGNRLDEVLARLGTLLQDANQTFSLAIHPDADPNLLGIDFFGPTLPALNNPSTLEKYQSQEHIVQAPALILTIEIVGLILFFVSVVIGSLVEREQLAIAVMRSRGSSRLQIFVSLLLQTCGLCLCAILLGPLLALGMVYLVIPRFLVATNQDAFNVLFLDPAAVFQAVCLYTLTAVAVIFATLALTTLLVVRANVLTRQREEARSIERPLWYRQRLDLAVACLAVAGYLLILYLQHAQQYLSAQGQILVSAPLELLAPLLLVLAGILAFLRLFPLLLRLLAYLARRVRGLSPGLALSQMERAPRQPMQMSLLLGLSAAFVFFSLVFSASQEQRAQDIANYQAVSDFAGYTTLLPGTTPDDTTAILTRADLYYRKIQGVTSVTVGYIDTRYLFVNSDTGQAYAHRTMLTAVDADTFAQTAFWSSQDSSQSLPELMALLNARRSQAAQQGVVPAIVAASTWQMLGLTPGMTFRLTNDLGEFDPTVYEAVAEVRHIPPTDDGTQGALLVDYQSLVDGRARYQEMTQPNYIWLRTSDSPALVNQVRAALGDPNLALVGLVDRRALSRANALDPLAGSLLIILSMGVITALLLALLANLLLPLLSIQARQTRFAVLRALGATPGEITRLLAWELAICLGLALMLGILFGLLLVFTLVAPLVFTGVLPGNIVDLSNVALYTLQQIIPVTIVFPSSLSLALVALLLLCGLAVGLMTRLAQRTVIAQALLVDDD